MKRLTEIFQIKTEKKTSTHLALAMAVLTQKCVESIKFKKILDNNLIGLLSASHKVIYFIWILKREKSLSLYKVKETTNKQSRAKAENQKKAMWVAIELTLFSFILFYFVSFSYLNSRRNMRNNQKYLWLCAKINK